MFELQGQLLFGLQLTSETRNTYFRLCPFGHCGQKWKTPARCCHKIDSANRKLFNKLCGLTVGSPLPTLPFLGVQATARVERPLCARLGNGQVRVSLCSFQGFYAFLCLPTTLLLVSLVPILQMRPTKRALGRGTGHVPVGNWPCDLEQVASPPGVDPKLSPPWEHWPGSRSRELRRCGWKLVSEHEGVIYYGLRPEREGGRGPGPAPRLRRTDPEAAETSAGAGSRQA